MQTYILLTKLASESGDQLKNRAEASRNWLELVKDKCPEIRFLNHYALLGRYDFLDIFEAPNEDSAAKVSLISRTNGAFYAESLLAIPHKHFLELSQSLSKELKQ